MSFGGPEGIADPAGITPEFEHWFAQLRNEVRKAAADPATLTGLTITGVSGIDFSPGSDVDVDLLTVNVTGTPRVWWDEVPGFFRFSQGFIVDNGGVSITGSSSFIGEVNLDFTGSSSIFIAGSGGQLGFYGTPPTSQLTVIGIRDSNTALASLLSALDTLGLIVDSTTAT